MKIGIFWGMASEIRKRILQCLLWQLEGYHLEFSLVITKELIHKLSQLARIRVNEEDLREQLADIIDYVELLSEVDTKDVPPCIQVVEGLDAELRDDEEGELLTTFLDGVPDQVGGMVRVPPVMK